MCVRLSVCLALCTQFSLALPPPNQNTDPNKTWQGHAGRRDLKSVLTKFSDRIQNGGPPHTSFIFLHSLS